MPIIKGWIDDFRPFVRCKVAGEASPELKVDVVALIDTGSNEVMVHPDLAARLGLVTTGSIHSERVGIAGNLDATRVVISFFGAPDTQNFNTWNCDARALISDFGSSAELLIGMNVLAHGKLTIDGSFVEIVGPRQDGAGLP